MDDLIEFLRAQLDDEERVTQAEIDAAERAFPAAEFDVEYGWSRRATFRANGAFGTSTAPGAPTPKERLAEVDAKRRILDDCARYADVEGHAVTDGLSARTVAALALPYADRRGYRDEWRL